MTRRPSQTHHAEREPRGERLQRVLAARGVASRRASEGFITDGRVQVNGETVTELGTRVDALKDEIRVDGKILKPQRPRFLILNKPGGFITTTSDEKQRWTVMDLIQIPERIYPVGRLDRETQGLLLLTNDGDVANRVMHPKYGLAKEYHVITARKPNDRQMQRIRDGIEIQDRLVVPDECRILRETREGVLVKIVIHEGLYHVVRQIMESVGITVHKLRRVRIGPLNITGIPSGAWRDLTAGELVELYAALGLDPMAAEEVNSQRPMQVTPVGSFQHAAKGGEKSPRTPQSRGGSPGGESPGPHRSSDNRSQSDKRHNPGRKQDVSRPSQGDRNRRSRRGR